MSEESLEVTLERLNATYGNLPPRLRQAAKFILDHPAEVAVNSMRKVAGQAGVAPSSLVRLSRVAGFENYEAFRRRFSDGLRRRAGGYSERALSLQTDDPPSTTLTGRMSEAHVANIERMFAATTAEALERSAERMIAARRIYVIGMLSSYGAARYVQYVARMIRPEVVLIRGEGGGLAGDIVDLGAGDLLLAIGFAPYARSTVLAVEAARTRGAAIVAVTDSRTSPLAVGASDVFLCPTESPQFFPSLTAAVALLETLLAHMVAGGGEPVIRHVDKAERMAHAMEQFCGDNRRNGIERDEIVDKEISLRLDSW